MEVGVGDVLLHNCVRSVAPQHILEACLFSQAIGSVIIISQLAADPTWQHLDGDLCRLSQAVGSDFLKLCCFVP